MYSGRQAEVLHATCRMKKRKASGIDCVPTELLQVVAQQTPSVLVDMADVVLEIGRFPKEHKTALCY